MAEIRIRHQSSDDCLGPSPLSSPAASLKKEQTEPKRCLTPRGPIFPSLQDAHRNITNRSLASNNPFGDEPSEASELDDNDTECQLTHGITSSTLENIASSSPWGKPLVGNPTSPRDLDSNVDSVPPLVRMDSGRSLTDVCRLHPSAAPNSTDAVHRVEATIKSSSFDQKSSPDSKESSENTVECIYGQYAADTQTNSAVIQDEYEPAYTVSPRRVPTPFPAESRDGAVNRFGFLNDEEEAPGVSTCPEPLDVDHRSSVQRQDFSRAQPRLRVEPALSQPPPISLPKRPARDIQGTCRASRNQDFESRAVDSGVTESQHLLDTDAPYQSENIARLDSTRQPLRSPFHDIRAAKACHPGGYFGGDAQSSIADTQSDLFKYDNEVYRDCLGSIKERDVSTALKSLSRANNDGARDRLGKRHSVSDCGTLDDTESSPWEDVHSSFFDADVLDSLEGGPSKGRDVKIVIKQRHTEGHHVHEELDQVGDLYHKGYNYGAAQDYLNRDETGGADWVTVATTNFDRASKSPEGLFGAAIQDTGSSLANLSDEDKYDPRNPFDDRDLVLQHPPINYHLSAFYKRTLKDTKQAVMLPGPKKKPAFPSNSSRDMLKGANDSNPFRQNSYRRANGQEHFIFPSGKDGPSKYEFRDSISEYVATFASTQALNGSDISGTHVDLHDLPNAKTPRREDHPRDDFALVDESPNAFAQANLASFDNCEASVMSPSFQFGFELLPLDQAKRTQRTQRDSGQSDQTNNRGRASKQNDRERQGSDSPKSPVTMISPPMAARIRGVSSHWHTCRTPRGPNSAVLIASTGKSSSTGQPLLMDEREVQSPITPTVGLDAGIRKSLRWPGSYTNRKQTSRLGHAYKTTPPRIKTTVCSSVDDNQISYHARARREFWFYMMVALSILPFFALLVLIGVFNDALSWFTQGEVYRLTRQQRRVIQLMFFVECILYTGCLAALIVYFAIRSQHF